MAIGEYDRRITLRKRELVKDEQTGQSQESWPLTDASRRYWSKVRALSANEQIAQGVLQSGASIKVFVRGRVPAFEAVDRLDYEDLTYAITGVFFDGTDTVVTASQPST